MKLLFSLLLFSLHPFEGHSAEFEVTKADYSFSGFKQESPWKLGSTNSAVKFGTSMDLEAKEDSPLMSGLLETSVAEGDCLNKDYLGSGLRVTGFALNMRTLGQFAACEELKDLGELDIDRRYAPSTCRLNIECSKAKMSRDEGRMMSFFTIPRLISEDFVGLKLEKVLAKMESTEALRKFAEKKYGKNFAPACGSRFDYDFSNKESSETCDAVTMDSGFTRMQNKCVMMKTSCYKQSAIESQKDFATFSAGFKPASEKDSLLHSFMTDRTDTTVNDSLGNDLEMLESLSSLISSKETTAIKLQNIYKKLYEYKKQGKLDPVFLLSKDSIDSSQEIYKKSPHYKFFEKLASSKTNSAGARASLEKYRMETAKASLGKDCEEVPRYSDVCKEATDLAKSKRVSLFERVHASMSIPKDEEDDRFELLKSIFPNGIKDLNDYSIIMEAQRCKAFKFGNGTSTPASRAGIAVEPANLYEETTGFGLPSTLGNGLYNIEGWNDYSSPGSSSLYSLALKPQNFERRLAAEISKKSADNTAAVQGPVVVNTPEVQKPIDSAVEKNSAGSTSGASGPTTGANHLSDSFQNTSMAVNGSVSSGGFYNGASLGNSAVINREKSADPIFEDEKKSLSSPSAHLSDKISDLSKKLAASEENLERMKIEKVEAEEQKIRQQKIDEENKTIADLKAQVGALKADSKKVNENVIESKMAETVASTPSLQSGGQKAAMVESGGSEDDHVPVPQASAAPSKSNQPASAASVSEGGSSGARFIKTSSAGSSGSAEAKSGLVLTQMDGLSSEKASERIYEKIMELKGVPFLIEEGGLVKEIVPKMVDDVIIKDKFGMPIYEKIVVGEVGKVGKSSKSAGAAKKGSSHKKDERSPASIGNVADLKRDQEEKLKYDRAQYLKLKKITTDALNKK